MSPANELAIEKADLQKRLDEIKALCQKMNHSGVNLETHRLADAVLKIVEREE